jgi:hypothetical protein
LDSHPPHFGLLTIKKANSLGWPWPLDHNPESPFCEQAQYVVHCFKAVIELGGIVFFDEHCHQLAQTCRNNLPKLSVLRFN